LQITHQHSGILVHSIEGAAYSIKKILNNPAMAQKLGENGKEQVRQSFLLIRHIRDYMLLMLAIGSGKDVTFL